MSRTVILCCPTLQKELTYALKEANSTAKVILLPDQLHNDPRILHSFLQEKINSIADVERIVICPSGCGGGTIGLRATNCELLIPKTRDCLDILLSKENIADIERPKHGVFFTESWAEYGKRSSINLDTLVQQRGREEAETFLRKLYKGFEHFYIIDTGVYEIQSVRDYLEPLRVVLDGTIDVVQGNFGVLRKIAAEKFDEDFLVVPRGECIPKNFFTVNRDL